MNNQEVARILKDIAILLDMADVPFKPRAYEKAALTIEALEKDVGAIYEEGGIKALKQIPGIGESIAEKLEELIKTGKLNYYEQLHRKVPVDLEALTRIEGVGPKTIKTLWQKLKISTVEDLEKAALEHRISQLPGFRKKAENNILKGIEFAKASAGRFVLGFTLPLIRSIEERLRTVSQVRRVVAAGSVRRMMETVGDVDFLVLSNSPQKVADYFVSMPEVRQIIEKGTTKSSVKLNTGMNADVRIVPEGSFGAALQYFTGNKLHNIALRRMAQDKGWKLNEYGLFEGSRQLAGRTEEEVYERLGLQWIPPELRENTGEIEAAKKRALPDLLDRRDVKGDLQVHSNWTDGQNSICEMAEQAKKNSLEYIVISDHSRYLAMMGGLDEEGLLRQKEEIDQVNGEVEGITVLQGVELNILKDGTLDVSDQILKKLEVVSAGIHSHFDMSREEMTKRFLKAVENPNVDIIVHPTARQIQKREPIQLDIEKVIETAREAETILDVDSYPDRLDLKDEHIRKAVQAGVKIGISTDSHSTAHLHYLELGVAQARRGWATAEDVVNTRTLEGFRRMLKN